MKILLKMQEIKKRFKPEFIIEIGNNDGAFLFILEDKIY